MQDIHLTDGSAPDGAPGGGLLVSIVVPAFNAAHTLAETLDSVAAQSHRNLEILIVDDGSTDATCRVATAFCAADERARVIAQDNRGVAAARNRGIGEARGGFVALIDADDVWHPAFVACCLARVGETNAAMVFSLYRQIDHGSRIIRSGPIVEIAGNALHRMTYCNLVGNGSGLLVSRAAALAVGGYDDRLRATGVEGCEDYLFQLKIAARYPIASVLHYLVGYRRHEGAMSNDVARMIRSDAMAITLFRASAPGLVMPDRVWRWRRAEASLTLSRHHFRTGRVSRAIGAALDALRLDATGTLAAMPYTLYRIAGVRWRGEDAALTGTAFAAADPRPQPPTRSRSRDPGAWLKRTRLRDVAALDRADVR